MLVATFMACVLSSTSFRGASAASEPGIHTPQRCGAWIPGPRLRRVPE